MHDEQRQPRTLATAGQTLAQSDMVDLLSAEQIPEPKAGRDVESQRVFDSLQNRLFGVETGPTAIGRWQLRGRLGRGAMGTVYEAYDPELERRVAVKVLHPMSPEIAAARRIRLRREAQAMARVKHPNLVEVHDVFADEPQPYVVMELIEGTTLRAWQEPRDRGWRAIVRAYLEAARGLAALHDVGLVHRDFKPDNAMIDRDGRVRVVDLGLVFAECADEDQGAPPSTSLTREGLLVGTLSYMSPEQLQGRRSDARSDQFSLCAALYEAVYVSRPYVGGDPEALLADMEDRRPPLAPNPRGAPRWLGRVLRIGLRRLPEQRFPHLGALIAALERGLGRRRRLALGAAALAVLGALSPLLLARTVDPCRDVDAELDGVWDASQERAIRQTFLAQGDQWADRDWSHLSASIHASRDQWLRLRRDTCPALREVPAAPSTLDRTRCLDEARLFMKHVAERYLEATSVPFRYARGVAASLAARVQHCSQIAPGSPTNPRPTLDVTIQTALIEAEAEQAMGQLARAQSVAEAAVVLAEQADLDVARAEARHRLGRILGHRRRAGAALEHLEAASRAATRGNLPLTHIDAGLFAAKVRVIDLGSADGLERELRDVEDTLVGLERAGRDVRARRAELHEVHGFAARLRGEASAEIEHFARALRLHGEPVVASWSSPCPASPQAQVPDVFRDHLDNPIDLLRGLNNLAFALGDVPEHLACTELIYRRALALADERLGELHPVSIDIRFDYGEHLGRQERTDEQVEVLRPVRDASAVQFGEESIPVADVLLSLATIAADQSDLAEAEALVRRAIALYELHCDDQVCPANYGNALLALAEVFRLRERRELAVPAYEAACEQLGRRGETAEMRVLCMYYLAEILIGLGRDDAARTTMAAAEIHFQRLGSVDEAIVELRQRLNRDNNQENKDAPPDRE